MGYHGTQCETCGDWRSWDQQPHTLPQCVAFLRKQINTLKASEPSEGTDEETPITKLSNRINNVEKDIDNIWQILERNLGITRPLP